MSDYILLGIIALCVGVGVVVYALMGGGEPE
jgi:hypothetical protein